MGRAHRRAANTHQARPGTFRDKSGGGWTKKCLFAKRVCVTEFEDAAAMDEVGFAAEEAHENERRIPHLNMGGRSQQSEG